MHTLRHFDKVVELHPILYYTTRCSMPLFFMAAGAIQLNKNSLSLRYCCKKIYQIILVMLGYYLIDLIVRITVNGFPTATADLMYLVKSLNQDFAVFWFLRTMIVLYLFLPVIYRIYKRQPKFVILILITLCGVIDIISVYNIEFNGATEYIQKHVRQEYRFWTWLMYYCIGGYIYSCYKKIRIKNNILTLLAIISYIAAVAYMFFMLHIETNIVNGEYAYDSVLLVIWSTLTMIVVLRTDMSRYQKSISWGASILIPVYALHIFVIKLFENYDIFHSYYMQLIGYMFILIITIFISAIMTKVPVIRRITYI